MSSKKQEKKNKKKFISVKKVWAATLYSIDGLKTAYHNEQSLWLHGLCTLIVIILGFLLKVNFYEWAVLIISLVVILAMELMNTAIEACVDLVTKEIHPLAKIAKDCGSAATFVSSIMALIICLFIFVPKVLLLI